MKPSVTSIIGACLAASRCLATDTISPDLVEADITTAELEEILSDLNDIGDANGGNRAFGLPGFKASVDYVLERIGATGAGALTNETSALKTWVQPFNHTFEQTREISVTGPDGEDVYVLTLLYNAATPVPDGVTGALVDTPVDDVRGSGCFADQWEGVDAAGKIALVKRGVCAIADKLKLAKTAGAVGALVYQPQPGTNFSSATLSADNIGLLVPAGLIPLEVAQAWQARLAAGEEVSATLLVDSIFETRETWNVFSETTEGDPDSVVVLGAHLDSVQAGPGVNDDGSGTSGLLAIINSVRKYTGLKNKIRFAWWAAEESGLVGSLYYTRNLPAEEVNKIKYYFNYDMIGSPFPVFAIYQSENSGGPAEDLLEYLTAQGKDAYFGSFGTGSDYVGFLNLGIPSSGIFTGAGAPTDPCYHLACDTITNIDFDAITVNTKAAGRLAAQLALSLDGVPSRNTTSSNLRGRMKITESFQKWARAEERVVLQKSCSHDTQNQLV